MTDLAGKVAIVTGGAGGIGLATARHLAACGARVAVADINEAGAAEAARTIQAAGGEAIGLGFDLADDPQVAGMVDQVVRRFGRLDIVHNNAADTRHEIVGRDTTAVDIDLAVWDRTFTVNLRGTMLMCRHAVPRLIETGGGSIINMSSIEGLAPSPGVRVAYATSKAAICMLTRHVAATWGKQGVRCNALAPGTTLTDTLKSHISPERLAETIRALPTPALGEPLDVARLVAFLASDGSGYINGQVLSIDGGALAFRGPLPAA
jgi:NAD(P)-dependent dehydrogenase (short-subunit alcohol dehydrogenase family)